MARPHSFPPESDTLLGSRTVVVSEDLTPSQVGRGLNIGKFQTLNQRDKGV